MNKVRATVPEETNLRNIKKLELLWKNMLRRRSATHRVLLTDDLWEVQCRNTTAGRGGTLGLLLVRFCKTRFLCFTSDLHYTMYMTFTRPLSCNSSRRRSSSSLWVHSSVNTFSFLWLMDSQFSFSLRTESPCSQQRLQESCHRSAPGWDEALAHLAAQLLTDLMVQTRCVELTEQGRKLNSEVLWAAKSCLTMTLHWGWVNWINRPEGEKPPGVSLLILSLLCSHKHTVCYL